MRNPQNREQAELEQALKETRLRLTQAYTGFNTVADSDLLESYIYEIQALRCRYSYLLRQRKQLGAEAPAPQELPLLQPRELPDGLNAPGPGAVLPVA